MTDFRLNFRYTLRNKFQCVFSKYNLSRRFVNDLLQFSLQFQEQFCNKMFPEDKSTYRIFRRQIRAVVYFPAILKWAKNEGQQRGFHTENPLKL